MNKILLATSIAPVGLENQKAAVQSWIESGFRVISCNIAEEIAVLKDEFPQVEFVQLTRSGKEIVGKPCPFIYDIMQALRERTDDVCGIVNSDIHFRHFTPDMIEYVRELAKEGVVLLKRQEIRSLDDIGGLYTQSMLGEDTFFFSKKNLEIYSDDGMMIGQPVWDHWIGSTATKNGVPVIEFINPVTFHITHPVIWKEKTESKLYLRLCKKCVPHLIKGDMMDFDALVRSIHQIVASKTMTRAYLPDEMKGKSIRLLYEGEKISQGDAADYIVEIPYPKEMLTFCNDYWKAVIWLMETYGFGSLHLLTWLKNKERELIPITYMDQWEIMERILPITVYQRGIKKEEKQPSWFQICNSWFFLEGDEKNNLKKNNVYGRVLIFPAGQIGRQWKEKYQDFVEIKGFVDNFRAGEDIDGLHIYTIDKLKETETFDFVVVATERYKTELFLQAKQICSCEKVVLWKENT